MVGSSFLSIPPDSDFPLQNLPYGVFSVGESAPRAGVRIGDFVLDLAVLEAAGLLPSPGLFERPTLNAFMAAGPVTWQAVREALQALLSAQEPTLRDDAALRRRALVPAGDVTMHLPAAIGDFTDFYASREHASNVGALFRPAGDPLLPNWRHLPVAYHGRASSIVTSGSAVRRPSGQMLPAGAAAPMFGPSRRLDFELELGFFVGPGNAQGEPIPIAQAPGHIFGAVLLNDWSARDIQTWEYRPLGPFLAKSFATTLSPWVVALAALAPFRLPGPHQEPVPLPYLRGPGDWAFDIELEVHLQGEDMAQPACIARSNARHLYWNICQMVAHHTANGCNLRPGDLLATGTISGPGPGASGSLLELTANGERPLALPGGGQRTFLADGDRLSMRGCCRGQGYRLGFGECAGAILPALPLAAGQTHSEKG